MSWVTIQTGAQGPHTLVGCEVYLPDRSCAGTPWPLVLLLHGRKADCSEWKRRVRLERYAEEAGVALALAEGKNSFFVNSIVGYNWGDYLAEELPAKLAAWFPVEERYVLVGVDSGAYGALMAAARFPEKMKQVVAVDPLFDIEGLYREGTEPDPYHIFGEKEKLAENGYLPGVTPGVPTVFYVNEEQEDEAKRFAAGSPDASVITVSGCRDDRMEEAFRQTLSGLRKEAAR